MSKKLRAVGIGAVLILLAAELVLGWDSLAGALRQAGLAVELDLGREKINAKVREHSVRHVPVIAVVGRKEAEEKTVALRRFGGDAQTVLALDAAAKSLADEATPPDLKRA